LRFSFRGDDDIWVFIGGKLAVDLGGTHLAAPAYVNLDNITDKNGLPLVDGEEYPIDIFFCDRRTTMSNVRIKTNMYIQQKTGIKYVPTTTTNPDNSVSKEYEFCWQETGDGSCAAALGGSSGSSTECCGAAIENTCGQKIDISLTRRDGTIVPGGSVADLADTAVYFGGIDLTNRYSPVINMGHMQGLSPGTYKLVVTIGNKSAPIQFRISGSLDVVTRDAINPEKTSQTWGFVSSAMAGTKIPIYISSIADPGNGGNLELDIEGAAGQTYSLTTSKGLNLYADSSSDVILAASDFPRTIESSGIDTLWATVPLAAMTASTEAHTVQVAGRTSVANLTFYAPQIMFADAAGTQLNKLTDTMWVGSTYNVRLIAYNPATNTPCTDCNFSVSRGSQTSNKVETLPATIDIVNGEAVVTLRSLTEYMQTPAMLSLVGPNAALLKATLDSLYFKDPPVPFPVLAEIFDKHGVPSAKTLAIPTPYFSTSQEYLDGIADSLVVHYHRSFHKDSLPDSVFVKWDLKAENGGVLDSIKLDKNQIMAGTNCNGDLCDSILRFGGVQFSKGIQTVGSPNTILSSWATYLDKTRPVSLASQAIITDRIPPILLKGRVSNVKGSAGFDRVALLASEPVLIKNSTVSASYGLSAFTYYLKSATEVGNTPDAKYLNVIANSGDLSAARDTVMMLYNNTDNLKPSPRAGDYVRFRADIAELISDVEGNFPTSYDAEVASPWAPIEGDAKSEVLTISLGTPDPDKIKKDMEEGKVVEAIPVDIYDSKDTIQAKNPNTLGHIVKTDMGNILTAPEFIDVKAEEVTLSIKTQYFTNLGSFVAESNHNIRCDAPFFNGNYPADTSSKGDCRQNPKYVYVAWNMLSQDNRKVGTGAYIAKLSTYVNIQGRKKTAKHDQTEMWGVRRGGNIFK
jgi:fibro-slime domain-containing protein